MTGFRITDHARAAMVRRRIPDGVVARILDAPDAVLDDARPERRIYQAEAEVGEPLFLALVRIVVDVSENPPAVVTVYATTNRRRYGSRQ